jgi:hypothetical protein
MAQLGRQAEAVPLARLSNGPVMGFSGHKKGQFAAVKGKMQDETLKKYASTVAASLVSTSIKAHATISTARSKSNTANNGIPVIGC